MKTGRLPTGVRTTEEKLRDQIVEVGQHTNMDTFPKGIFVKQDGTDDYVRYLWEDLPELQNRQILKSLKSKDGTLQFARVYYKENEAYKVAFGLVVKDAWRLPFGFNESGMLIETPGEAADLPIQIRRNHREKR